MSTESEPISLEKTPAADQQLPKFTIANLLRLTALVAGIAATLRLLGPQASWVVFLLAYGFAPTIAMIIYLALRGQPKAIRMIASGLTLFVFAAAMSIICGLVYDTDAMLLALLAAVIEWPGQIMILACLYLIHRGFSGRNRGQID